jgi:hypothetical protein
MTKEDYKPTVVGDELDEEEKNYAASATREAENSRGTGQKCSAHTRAGVSKYSDVQLVGQSQLALASIPT